MERAARDAPHRVAGAAAWTEHAFGRLTVLPGVRRVGLALVEGGGRRLQFTASDRSGEATVSWCLVDAYDDVPLNTAVRTGAPVVGPIDDLAARYAAFADAQAGTENVALAAIPIIAGGTVIGGYVLYFDDAQRFDDLQRGELLDLGHDLGESLRRTWRRGERRPGLGEASPPGARVAVHEATDEPVAVGGARRFLRRTLASWQIDADTIDSATLCLSELVTNAVIHAQGGCVVRAQLHDDLLTVSVTDAGVSASARVDSGPDPLQVHGRGLQVVDALATRWGHEFDAGGASVWFALEVA